MADNTTLGVSSFVTEILSAKGKFEKEDLNVKLDALKEQNEEIKLEIHDAVHKRYRDFFPSLHTAVDLSSKVKAMSSDMEEVGNRVDKEIKSQLTSSSNEFCKLSSKLTETKNILVILEKLVKVYDGLNEVKTAQKSKDFVKAVKCLNSIQESLDQPLHENEVEVELLAVLQKDYQFQMEKVIQDLGETWLHCVHWDVPKDVQAGKQVTYQLQLPGNKSQQELLASALQALNELVALEPKLKVLGDRLMLYVFTPVLSTSKCKVQEEENGNMKILKLHHIVGEKDVVTPKVAFPKLVQIFKFLNLNLGQCRINMADDTNECLMEVLGRFVATPFVDMFIKEVLAHSIPSSNKDLQKYKVVSSNTHDFEKMLKGLNFLPEGHKPLSDYVGDVNVLFANKKTKEILEKARNLMTSDIHSMIKITGDAPLGELAPSGPVTDKSKKTLENVALKSDVKLSDETFRLPVCHISDWAQQLVVLAYETMHEAATSSLQCGIQLFYTTRMMFELYCNVVPTYHRDSLATLPQLSALHHNNCMFIAHHLTTMGHQYRHKLPAELQQGAVTLVDLVPMIRRIGTECFIKQLNSQKTQLMEFINGAQGLLNVSEESTFESAERAIKQSLHQLQRLSRVWNDILPENIFCKAIGTLLNAVVVELINCVTALEDISADDANQLLSLLAMVTDKATELFPIEDTDTARLALVHKNVPQWVKYKELMTLLDASLQQIADRWAEGKGPLAAEFTANEVKQLIRALFQNTDRRAAVLAKIR